MPTALDVAALVKGMYPLAQRTLGEHVEISLVCGDGVCPALADCAQLESAILNLCINARDAMPDGGRIEIALSNAELDAHEAERRGVSPGRYVLIRVSDTGLGMDKAIAARAFEPFFTTKEFGHGSGLGLSMVYGFARQSRGCAQIESWPGKGTCVSLYLPCAEPQCAHASNRLDDRGWPDRQKVLLVEDDDLVRAHMAAQLRGLGFDVIPAVNGKIALELLAGEERFDLLFTDIVMPGGINGYQLAAKARLLRAQLPVLYTSGYAPECRPSLTEGETPVLDKPFTRAQLAEMVQRVLAPSSM